MKRNRRTEIAYVLPWIGAFLLTPPVILAVQNWSASSGVPLFHIYIFVCWAALILTAWRLSAAFARRDPGPRPGSRPFDPGD